MAGPSEQHLVRAGRLRWQRWQQQQQQLPGAQGHAASCEGVGEAANPAGPPGSAALPAAGGLRLQSVPQRRLSPGHRV